jgi:ParB-like chromosome segregation protein Spo0J
MKTIEPTRELIPLKLIEPWARNPRGGELREMESFTEQLRMEGIREDVHVFRDAQGVMRLMQGHRRREAAGRLGMEALWAKVWPFDEADAFRHLMTMQNGANAFSPLEMARGAREALLIGIPMEELPGICHRSMETVQLYLSIEKLPHRAQQLVEDKKLSLESAGLLAGLTNDQVREMMGDIVNPFTGEVYSYKQLKDYVTQRFIKPEKQRAEWEKNGAKWRLKVIENNSEKVAMVQLVVWDDREEYVQEQAVKQSAYELAHEWLPTEKLAAGLGSCRWWDLAAQYDVPVMMAPAMDRDDEKFLLLVNRAVVEAADSVALVPMLRKNAEKKAAAQQRNEEGGMTNEGGQEGGERRAEGGESDSLEGSESPSLQVSSSAFDEVRWRKVHGALMLKPEAAMQNALWEALMGSQWEALAAILPGESYASLMGELNRDGVKRKGLRWCLLACVALALCAEDEEGLSVVEGALGTAG